jgi:hypothetical protein
MSCLVPGPEPVPSDDNPFGAYIYKLHGNTNMGDLRVQASREFDSDDEVLSTHRFLSLPLHATKHTALRGGKDNSNYAYHIPRGWLAEHDITDDYIEELVRLLEDLPPPRKKGKESRGIKDTRHYQFWIGSKQDEQAAKEGREKTGLLHLSADYIHDGEKGQIFNDHCAKLWKTVGDVHSRVFKRCGDVLRRFKAPTSAIGRFLARPWPGMSINRGHIGSPVQSKTHKDMFNAFYGMAVLFVCGDFTGGDVIFWELEVTIPVKSGDILIFPGHLISHSNTKVTGVRHSLVAYAKQETMSHNQNKRDRMIDEAQKKKVERKRQKRSRGIKKDKKIGN